MDVGRYFLQFLPKSLNNKKMEQGVTWWYLFIYKFLNLLLSLLLNLRLPHIGLHAITGTYFINERKTFATVVKLLDCTTFLAYTWFDAIRNNNNNNWHSPKHFYFQFWFLSNFPKYCVIPEQWPSKCFWNTLCNHVLSNELISQWIRKVLYWTRPTTENFVKQLKCYNIFYSIMQQTKF